MKDERDISMETNVNDISMDVNRAEFALALKTWRLRQGLTQKQVAERWNTNRWAVMNCENCKDVKWETAYRMFAMLAKELRKEGDHDAA